MPDSYSDQELNRYFNDPEARRRPQGGRGERPQGGVRGFFHRRIGDPRKAQAAFALSIFAGFLLVCVLAGSIFLLMQTDELPSLKQLENPDFQLATIAYTADGEVLARYATQNRSWVTLDEISPHVVHALLATEDRRFYNHWGVDMKGIFAAIFDLITEFDLRGASTISMQLAGNLYNQQIDRQAITIERKLKEIVTAVELERRYTKKEIIEMYLNTVPFAYRAWGIEAAAHYFYSKSADELNPLQAATLIGMLQATTYYNPIRNPENAHHRRNVVLWQMVKTGYLSEAFYEEHHDDPIETDHNSPIITESLAPYFAAYVREWVEDWAARTGHDFYSGGLRVFTTLNSHLQEIAKAAAERQMTGLQAVVDYGWSRPSNYVLGTSFEPYLERRGEFEPFEYFWTAKQKLVNEFIRETRRYQALRDRGLGREEAVEQLRANQAFMDSLKTRKTTLQVGLVSIDPHTGYVKAWVGGRNFEKGKYGHVAIAERQPGSTFKPFVYTAAIDNGYSPYYTLRDSAFAYHLETGKVWQPTNFGGSSGEMIPLSQGLARSLNTITARVMMKLVSPEQVAFYARRMGIRESELVEVPALALGASEVTLLEMTAAYSTLANGGLYYPPTVVTRIEDRYGNVLYEYTPAPEEALSEETAYTIVDMMRGVIDYGTGQRIRWQWGLGEYDLAGKTGTTQEAADGWFMLMHPQLVTGAWVGFNDRRITFRSQFWGQGAHTGLFVVGDYFSHAVAADSVEIAQDARFPLPRRYESVRRVEQSTSVNADSTDGDGQIGW